MSVRISDQLQTKIAERLAFYEDLDIKLFYRDRSVAGNRTVAVEVPTEIAANSIDTQEQVASAFAENLDAASLFEEEETLPKQKRTAAAVVGAQLHPESRGNAAPQLAPQSDIDKALFAAPIKTSNFFASLKTVPNDSLLKIREDIGDCQRCRLGKTRNHIVFADGNPKAELVFVGEGPGADEDATGIPFVGRAGKLLTQMIEAMGLQRKDVYICNVVKCRPPGNRPPEPDEVATCSPFLVRQLEVINPKVIVALGATAAKTLLETEMGISKFRGQWLDFRGKKLMATYHPAYLLRNPPAKSEVWKDLQKVMAELGLDVKKPKPV
jgi:uracil-DNA glycosylase